MPKATQAESNKDHQPQGRPAEHLATEMNDKAVVRVYCTSQAPDYDSPWQSHAPSRSTGSGVIINGNRILTAAHVVANATFVQIQRVSVPDKAIARVEVVCHDADLAVLRIDDDSFFSGISPAQIGDLPRLRDEVSVVGFPVGGEELSITEGVVSRVEVQRYTHSRRSILAVTVDAAINSGNSGGPVFQRGKVVGIAFQALNNAENIGEMVPAPIIKTFLKGLETQRQPRVPALGIATQNLENALARKQLGLSEDEGGIMICAVEFGGAASGLLKERDTLLAIDGQQISNNATIAYRGRYRTRFDVLLGERYLGDEVCFDVMRDGKRVEIKVPLKSHVALVPLSQYDTLPSYFVYAGLVFQPLSRDFLTCWTDWWNEAPKEFLAEYYGGSRSEDRQEMVVLSRILADEINVGFEHLYNEGILTVNGEKPGTMRNFVRLIDEAEGVVEIVTSRKGVAWFDVDAVKKATPRILERYRIPADRSEDLKAVLK